MPAAVWLAAVLMAAVCFEADDGDDECRTFAPPDIYPPSRNRKEGEFIADKLNCN